MPEPPLSPSQQVERIREILVGRQMQQVEDRLERLERLMGSTTAAAATPFPSPPGEHPAIEPANLPPQSGDHAERDDQIAELSRALAEAREQLETATAQIARHDQLITEDLRLTLENINTSAARRVDARVRELLDHMQSELTGMRTELTHDLNRVDELKADRSELRSRFSRLASAAMEDGSTLDPPEGFLP